MSAVKTIEIPVRQNPFAGDLYDKLVKKFPLSPLDSKETHDQAKTLFLNLIRFKRSSDDVSLNAQINAYLGSLKLLIADYEKKHFKFDGATPIEILKELMERHGLKQTDLENEIGKQPHVSRILNGERPLTIQQVKALAKRFNVSPEIFIS